MTDELLTCSTVTFVSVRCGWLQFFEGEGCRMVEMTCEDHDRIAASTQFMTHTVGRILGSMDLGSTAIDTKGFQSLLSLVDNTTHDSFDLYYGLFMYNAVRAYHLASARTLCQEHGARQACWPCLHSPIQCHIRQPEFDLLSPYSKDRKLGASEAQKQLAGCHQNHSLTGRGWMQNATEELQRLELAFESVKKQLFGRLHDIARAQLFQQAPNAAASPQERGMLTVAKQPDGSGRSSLNGVPQAPDTREEQRVR